MIKRDKVFYAACGLFVAGLAVAALGWQVFPLFLIGAYLLRPFLHSFGLAGKLADERQKQIHSRSGNVAFVAVILAAAVLAVIRSAQGEQPSDLWALICIGIAVRALVGLLMVGEPRTAGVTIVVSMGVLYLLFNLMEGGLSIDALMNGLPGFLILALGLAARKFPRFVAAILAAAAVGSVFFFHLYRFNQGSLMVILLLPVPMLIAAGCLWAPPPAEPDALPSAR